MSRSALHAAPSSVFVVGSLVLACCATVSRCPEPGESLSATGFIMEPGGKGFNVALAAHRLGVGVDGVFAVGDDFPGAFMRKTFADAGLDAGIIQTVGAATGAGVGLIQQDGENRIAVYPGANAFLSAEHVHRRADQLRAAGLVYAQFEAPDDAIASAFALARKAGVTTVLNPSPYRAISDAILASTDILVMNEQEAQALAADRLWTGPYDTLAMALEQMGVGTTIITQGAKGAMAWHRGTFVQHPGFAVEVVDSIGAGDAFAGGLIAGLSRDCDLSTALRWGCAAGAVSVTRLGLVSSLPDAVELAMMLNDDIGSL